VSKRYHFVLEAPFLIEQHLRNTGREKYFIKKDSGKSIRDIAHFIMRYFSSSSTITLSFGKPMDVLGNFVDDKGNSFDRFGQSIEIADYFRTNGKIDEDRQREEQYTQILADRIVERFHAENVVLSSHLVAFAVFKMLENEKPDLDLYGLLRLPPDDFVFPIEAVERTISQMQTQLFEWEKQEKIKLSEQIHLPAMELIRDGIQNLGILHTEKPLVMNRDGDIVSNDFKTLFFYHNRLENYKLEKAVKWKDAVIEVLQLDE
jgi:glycerol-3-phosphate O-acyltransferase